MVTNSSLHCTGGYNIDPNPWGFMPLSHLKDVLHKAVQNDGCSAHPFLQLPTSSFGKDLQTKKLDGRICMVTTMTHLNVFTITSMVIQSKESRGSIPEFYMNMHGSWALWRSGRENRALLGHQNRAMSRNKWWELPLYTAVPVLTMLGIYFI